MSILIEAGLQQRLDVSGRGGRGVLPGDHGPSARGRQPSAAALGAAGGELGAKRAPLGVSHTLYSYLLITIDVIHMIYFIYYIIYDNLCVFLYYMYIYVI